MNYHFLYHIDFDIDMKIFLFSREKLMFVQMTGGTIDFLPAFCRFDLMAHLLVRFFSERKVQSKPVKI